MNRLKEIIEQYSRWKPLTAYVSRIEAYKDSDYTICIENSKSLLESIGKEICQTKGIELEDNSSIHGIMKQAFKALGYSLNDNNAKISKALATIALCIGELRNDFGATSHGKSLYELENQKDSIDEMTKEFLLGATELISCLLISLAEKEVVVPIKEQKVLYDEYEDFNQYWDEAFGEFNMGEYSYTASEVLYNMDYEAYKVEVDAYYNELNEENNEEA
jgi:hypothetical protein